MKDKYRVNRNKEKLKKWNNAKLKAEMPKYKSSDLVKFRWDIYNWIKKWDKIKE